MDLAEPDLGGCVASAVSRIAVARDAIAAARATGGDPYPTLGAAWCVVAGRGDSILGDLSASWGGGDAAERLATFVPPETAPAQGFSVQSTDAVASLCLWLPQHTRLHLLFGRPAQLVTAWNAVL